MHCDTGAPWSPHNAAFTADLLTLAPFSRRTYNKTATDHQYLVSKWAGSEESGRQLTHVLTLIQRTRRAWCHLNNNTLTVLHIWATYISNRRALCNTPLLIFKCVPPWSNYNWAFMCFGPWLWGIDALWRGFSGTETNWFTSLLCGLRRQAGSLRLKLKQRMFLAVTENQTASCCYFSLFTSAGKVCKRNLFCRGRRLERVDSVTAVTELWQPLVGSAYFDSATLKALASRSRCANLHNGEVQ